MSNREKQNLVREALASRMETKQAERGASFLVTKEDGSVQLWSWYKPMSRTDRANLLEKNKKLIKEGKQPLPGIGKLDAPILLSTMKVARTPKNGKEWVEKKDKHSSPRKRLVPKR